MRHLPFLEAAEENLLRRTNLYIKGAQNAMTRFKGQEMANLLWAFAILDYPVKVLDSVSQSMVKMTVGSMGSLKAAPISRVFKRQELANIAWSSAVFGEYPQDLIKLLYCGLVGLGKERDISFLNQCFGDGGLQEEAVMSLIYLQIALERNRSDNDLTLPEGFPNGWCQKTKSRDSSELAETFELHLSTSKIQRDVGAAFNRIGFDHVEEHVLTADELLDNQGIPLSNGLDVISIDIANPESRIGIEVDGPAHYVVDITSDSSRAGYTRYAKDGRMEYQFYMSDGRHRVNGPTALKKRLLEQSGWTLINVPFWEWDDLNGDEAKEEAYCRALLSDSR